MGDILIPSSLGVLRPTLTGFLFSQSLRSCSIVLIRPLLNQLNAPSSTLPAPFSATAGLDDPAIWRGRTLAAIYS
jgi:hypothetical protein